MLLWKLGTLSLVDVGAGDLWVDGEPVALSLVLAAGIISFGCAEIVVEKVPKRAMPTAQDAAGIAVSSEKTELETPLEVVP